MQKVNTFETAFEAQRTTDGHEAYVTGLGRAYQGAWDRLFGPFVASFESIRGRSTRAKDAPNGRAWCDSTERALVDIEIGGRSGLF